MTPLPYDLILSDPDTGERYQTPHLVGHYEQKTIASMDSQLANAFDRRSFKERLGDVYAKAAHRDKAMGSRYRVSVMDVIDRHRQNVYFTGIRRRKKLLKQDIEMVLEGRSPYEQYLLGFRPTGGC